MITTIWSHFRASNYWFYVPIIGPHIGAIVGSLLYDLFVGLHWPPPSQATTEDEAENESGLTLKVVNDVPKPANWIFPSKKVIERICNFSNVYLITDMIFNELTLLTKLPWTSLRSSYSMTFCLDNYKVCLKKRCIYPAMCLIFN